MANLFAEFKALIPKEATTIATLSAVYPDGTAIATSLDGHPMKLIGAVNYSAGSNVIVQGNRIIGSAPNLPSFQEYI